MENAPNITARKVKKTNRRRNRASRRRYNRAMRRNTNNGSALQALNFQYCCQGPDFCWYWQNYHQATQWHGQHCNCYWQVRCFAREIEVGHLHGYFEYTKINPPVQPDETSHVLGFWDVESGMRLDIGAETEPPVQPDKTSHVLGFWDVESGRDLDIGAETEPEVTPFSLLMENEEPRVEEMDNLVIHVPSDSETVNDSEESFEFAVNEEMLSFFETSMKHKLELKKKRDQERIQFQQNEIQEELRNDLPPPLVSKERTERLTDRYGESAPKIGAMETATELTFGRRVHQKVHNFWPVITLK